MHIPPWPPVTPLSAAALALSLSLLPACNPFAHNLTESSSSSPSTANGRCTSAPCGNGSSLSVCTQSAPNGACASISYEVGSETFACASCSDCAQAATLASQACTNASSDAGGGTTNPFGSSGGGSTTCSATQPCGTSGASYEECTTTGANGACASIDFVTTDGQTFSCNGCTDCTAASQALSRYCTGGTGTGGGTGTTTCSGSVACGSSGATYEECTTTDGNGACSQIVYKTSDGQTFTCNGCSDCTQAAQDLTSYCSASAGGGGGGQCGSVTCGSAATCCSCSGQPTCLTLQSGLTCASYGCN